MALKPRLPSRSRPAPAPKNKAREETQPRLRDRLAGTSIKFGSDQFKKTFPGLSGLIDAAASPRVREQERAIAKAEETASAVQQDSVESIDGTRRVIAANNRLLQEIIDAMQRGGGNLPGGAGRRPPPRRIPPGRGKYGNRARQRLQRMQSARRTRAFQRAGARAGRAYSRVRAAAITTRTAVSRGAGRVSTIIRDTAARIRAPSAAPVRLRVEPRFTPASPTLTARQPIRIVTTNGRVLYQDPTTRRFVSAPTPESPQTRPSATPTARPTATPAARPTPPSAAARIGGAALGALRVAERILAPTLFLDMETALRDMGDRAEYLPANRLLSFRRTLLSAQQNVETYNALLRSLETEQDYTRRVEIERDIERQGSLIVGQRDRLLQMVEQLDQQAQAQYQRRIARSQDGRMTVSERIVQLAPIARYILGDARDTSLEAVRRPSDFRSLLERALQGASIPAPTAQEPVERAASTVPAAPASETVPVSQANEGLITRTSAEMATPVSDATKTDIEASMDKERLVDLIGSTRFDEIVFDADELKFEGSVLNILNRAEASVAGLSPEPRSVMIPEQSPPATLSKESTLSAPGAVPSGAAGTTPLAPGAAGAAAPSQPAGASPASPGLATPISAPAATAMPGRASAPGSASRGSAATAMQFFISKGWTPAQAAGIVGNLDVETGGTFNPAAVGDGGRAYGIAQWHPDRQANFRAWSGQDIRGSTFEQQLEFVHHELTAGREQRAGTILRQATIAEQAAALVDQFYERSSGIHRAQRISRALQYSAASGQVASGAGVSPSVSGPALAAAGTNMVAGDQRLAASAQQGPTAAARSQAPTTVSNQTTQAPSQASGEVPLNRRLMIQAQAA